MGMWRKIITISLASVLGVLAVGWAEVWAVEVPLTIRNPAAVVQVAQPITSGVPFAQGVLSDPSMVRLLQGMREVPAQFLVTARWPDHSIRWLLCDFQTDLPAGGTARVTLQTGTEPAPVSGVTVTDGADVLVVTTRAASFTFAKSQFSIRGIQFTARYGGNVFTAVPDVRGWTLEESGPMKAVVRVDGVWRRQGSLLRDSLIRFRARLFFYRNQAVARVALTFKNNNSWGWDTGLPARPNLIITGLDFGRPLLAAGSSYVFGCGVEKTFETVVSPAGIVSVRDSRYNHNGLVAAGYVADRPLAQALPSYYAATRAWGRFLPPLSGQPGARQQDLARFEKLQRAKVNPADLENPPNLTGITAFQHLYQDISSWHDYGDLRWGGDFGVWSGNHYDWSYGLYLHFMRTGHLPFANLARVMARHEIDLDLYHTNRDSAAFNYQKNWESRPSHNSPNNTFGGGRPSHTWVQGYALHWLLTGDPRGRDGFEEILAGVRQYVYESFNGEGYIDTNEIRICGWLAENLIALWRINPEERLRTTSYGSKSIPQALKDIFKNVFDRERAAGGRGFVYGGDATSPDPNLREPLMNCYFIEPAAMAYEEVFASRDQVYADRLLNLVTRMTRFLMSLTYGGDTNGSGWYRPRQIPYLVDLSGANGEGQIPYLLMASNAAGFCYLHGKGTAFLDYARLAFRDYIRYMGVADPDSYIDPALRTPTCYNSAVYVNTESKVHGWSGRYGMYYLAAEDHAVNQLLPTPRLLLQD
jgi:hypothetical protein